MSAGEGFMATVVSCPNDNKSPFGLPEKESECYRKLILVLLKILSPNFVTSDDTVYPKLLDYIKRQGQQSKTDHDVLMKILCEWLKKVCQDWSTLHEEPKVFALKVAGYVASYPTSYERFSSDGSLTALLAHVQDHEIKTSNAVDLGYLCLMDSLMANNEASRLILQSGIWKNVVNMALSSSSIYSIRQATQLIATMLKTTDERTCEVILRAILKICPPSGALTLKPTITGLESQKSLSSKDLRVVSTLNSFRLILMKLMEVGHPRGQIQKLISYRPVTEWTQNLLQHSTIDEVLDAANKLACLLNSILFYQNKDENGLISFEDSLVIMDAILNHTILLNKRCFVYHIIDACVEYFQYLHKYGATVAGDTSCDDIGKVNEDVPFSIHNLLYACLMLPALLTIKTRTRNCLVDILEEFIDKLFRITNSKVMRYAYSYRDTLVKLGEKLCDLGSVIMQKFTQICPVICKEQGILVFQAGVHVLEEFVARPEESVGARSLKAFDIEGEDMIRAFPGYLSSVLNCVHCYLSRFNFSWRDSLESLCLLNILQKLLESPSLTSRLTVEVLKLIDLVLQKFLPPNLALLVDTIKGSTIEELGPQLYKRLLCKDWAVQDSTLEVVKTICTLSESSFPAFQALLIDNRLPQVVFEIVGMNTEPFVRTSAVSCLQELAYVSNVWETTLSDKNITEKLLLILHYESEGIVRVAAAKAISALYTQRKQSLGDLEVVYDTMSHVGQHDLHWEVKMACLDFWGNVMGHTIREQGMMDGVFPDFVFSKDKKKIVKLTPDEVYMRVKKAFHELGQVGCLQVLYDAFTNDSELEVQRKAGALIKKIRDAPKNLNVTKPHGTAPKNTAQDEDDLLDFQNGRLQGNPRLDDMETDSHAVTNVEDVIEQIVAEADCNLLSCIVVCDEKKTLPRIKRVIMTDRVFTDYLRQVSVDDVLAERTKWVADMAEGIVSLLDDILLFSSNAEEADGARNAIDCY